MKYHELASTIYEKIIKYGLQDSNLYPPSPKLGLLPIEISPYTKKPHQELVGFNTRVSAINFYRGGMLG